LEDEKRKSMYVAKFSSSYRLILQEGADDAWDGMVDGPCPARDQRISISGLEEAKHALYEFADKHFSLRGIVEPRIPKHQIRWDSN
jgi:hypothetical protein